MLEYAIATICYMLIYEYGIKNIEHSTIVLFWKLLCMLLGDAEQYAGILLIQCRALYFTIVFVLNIILLKVEQDNLKKEQYTIKKEYNRIRKSIFASRLLHLLKLYVHVYFSNMNIVLYKINLYIIILEELADHAIHTDVNDTNVVKSIQIQRHLSRLVCLFIIFINIMLFIQTIYYIYAIYTLIYTLQYTLQNTLQNTNNSIKYNTYTPKVPNTNQ